MKLKISSLVDVGLPDKERVVLKVLVDTDVGEFLLMQTGFNNEDNVPTVHVHYTYWFPYKEVTAGDLVVVYTKTGIASDKLLESGHKAHFFYWHLTNAIWSTKSRTPVLLYAPDWEYKNPGEYQK